MDESNTLNDNQFTPIAEQYLEFYTNSSWLQMGRAAVQQHLDDMLDASQQYVVSGNVLNPVEGLTFSDGSRLIVPDDAPAYVEYSTNTQQTESSPKGKLTGWHIWWDLDKISHRTDEDQHDMKGAYRTTLELSPTSYLEVEVISEKDLQSNDNMVVQEDGHFSVWTIFRAVYIERHKVLEWEYKRECFIAYAHSAVDAMQEAIRWCAHLGWLECTDKSNTYRILSNDGEIGTR